MTTGVGIDENLDQLLTIYPNPTTDELNISFAGNIEGAQLSVVSAIGADVLSFDAIPNSINVALLSNGTFFLVLVLPNGSKTTKLFVKQ